MSPDATGELLVRTLNRHGGLPCTQACNGEQFKRGRIYAAPSDHHIMISGDKILITKGAPENRSRPAIDPLFRSAAVAHGNRVIGKPIPKDIAIEARIAERVLSDLPSVEALGEQAPFNCPGCGGVLWRVGKGKSLRYRCHTGHAYTAAVLWAEQTNKIDETLWVALRMFEERRNLLMTMAETQSGGALQSSLDRAKQSEIHIQRIRDMLMSSDNGSRDAP